MTDTDPTARRPFAAATDDRAVQSKELFYFNAEGKVSGHGLGAWLPAPRYAAKTKAPDPIEHVADLLKGDPRPAVAILDSGIRSHVWLRDNYGEPLWEDDPDEFPLIDFEVVGRQAKGAIPVGTHLGHATFLAGIVRQAAPRAGLLSYRVMGSDGHATEDEITGALKRLASDGATALLAEKNLRLDVVLMAFGRPASAGTDDGDLEQMAEAMKALAAVYHTTERDLTFVVAAGNDGVEELHYPAALAADPDLNVVAVGGLGASLTERAPYSNYGPWVDAWRYSTNVFGAMPLKLGEKIPGVKADPKNLGAQYSTDCFAWWGGTSFAAAQYAGELLANPAQRPPSLPRD